jgi:MSHA biogenesis protein MshQ
VTGAAVRCRLALALAVASSVASLPYAAEGQIVYDYATRSQGVDALAHDGTSAVQVPTNSTVPATQLSSGEYALVAADDTGFHTLSTTTNNRYVQMRFSLTLEEPAATVTALELSWIGRGVNANGARVDGASLYVWNWSSSVYVLVERSANTEAEVRLGGALGGTLADYLGGASGQALTALVVTNDRRTGGTLQLSTDYLRVLVTARPIPIAEWRMEQASWQATPGEVVDQSASGYHGRALNGATTSAVSPAISGNPGTCRYAELDGDDDYVELPGFPDLSGSFTITAWVRSVDGTGDQRILADDASNAGGYALSVGDGGPALHLRFFSRGLVPVSIDSTAVLPRNGWAFVAASHDASTRVRRVYLDGALVAEDASPYTGSWSVDSGMASIGGEVDGTSESVPRWRFGGSLDELRVYDRALTAAQIAGVRAEMHDCPSSVSRFRVTHDGLGIHCLAEPVGVAALDAAVALVPGYSGTVTLDTGTGRGSWSSATSNQGSLSEGTPDDGVATYAFAAADGGDASFFLTVRAGATPADVDAYETAAPTVRDDDSEGPLAFAASGFTVTAGALPNPPPVPIADPIPTQAAGTSVPLHVAAYGTTPTDPLCGVIETYTGTKTLGVWLSRLDPATGGVAAMVNGTPVSSSSGAPTPLSVTFSSGQASVLAKYKDVGLISIALRDTGAGTPAGGIAGATNPFVVKPADFVVTSVTRPNGSANPGATTPSGSVFVAAGDPFAAVVEARDAEGSLTPNYGRESSPEGIRLESSTLIAPVSGRNGSANDGTLGNARSFTPTATPGRFNGSAFSFDEVGAVRLRARVGDGDYLGGGDAGTSESPAVGRFTAHHFDVSANAPELATACAPGGFSYLDQPFSFTATLEPRATATALSSAGTPTANYTGSWLRLSTGTLASPTLAAAAGMLTPAIPNPPTVTDLGAGVASIAFDQGPPLRFARGALTAPFDADVALSFEVRDADGVAYPANPVRFGQPVSGAGVAWSAGRRLHFGRLSFANASGSEVGSLAVPLRAESYDGGAFVPNLADICTAFGLASLAVAKTPVDLATSPAFSHASPLLGGDAGLVLSAPGAGNTGTADLRLDLGAVTPGAGLTHLRFDWDGDGALDDDPTGRASFGVHPGEPDVVRTREVYE